MLQLDHITMAALTLEQGVSFAETKLGISIPAGGKHPLMATHNHLLKLGDGIFLEIIAPDPDAQPQRQRWFGLDDPAMLRSLQAGPRLITWVVRTTDLSAALAKVPHASGPAIIVTRGALQWQISVADDSAMPFDGAFPTLIQWPDGPHVTQNMPDLGCALKSFTVEHAKADEIEASLANYLTDTRIAFKTAKTVGFSADIITPAGLRTLS